MRFREISAYSGLAYLNQVASVLLNLLFIRSLSLHTLGEIAIAKVWMQVIDYSHLGLRYSIDHYIPVWDRQRSMHLLWLCIGVSSLTSTVITGLALFFTENKLLIFVFCLWGYGVTIATILKNYNRASADVHSMLKTYFVFPSIPSVLQVVFFYFWGLNSYLLITAITSLTTVAYFLYKARSSLAAAWVNLRSTVSSVRSSAAMLFINSLIIFLTFSVDRIILNKYSTKAVVGEYSIVLFSFAILFMIPSTLAEFVFPKIVRVTAESGKVFYPREMAITTLPTIFSIVVAYSTAPFLVKKYTSYADLTYFIKIISLGVLPYAVTPILFHVMSALNMRMHLVLSACAVLCIYTLLLLWGVNQVSEKLEFFTIARAMFGYILLLAYWLCLMIYLKRKI